MLQQMFKMTPDPYPDRLEVRALDAKLVKLVNLGVGKGIIVTDEGLKLLRIFRFSMMVIEHARDRLNR